MSQLGYGNTAFEDTELGKAFEESAEIREEISTILDERKRIIEGKAINPVADLTRSLTAKFKSMPD